MTALGMVVLMFAIAPAVSIEVEAPEAAGQGVDPALKRWLVHRFVEDGVEVTPAPEAAGAVVRLRGTREGGLTVGIGSSRHRIDAGQPAVMQLEVWHRARVASEVEPTRPATTHARRVALDASGDLPEAFRGLLEDRLLAAGYAIAPRRDSGTAGLCVEYGVEEAALRVAGPTEQCPEASIAMAYATMARPAGIDPLTAWLDRALFGQPKAPSDDEQPPRLHGARRQLDGEADMVTSDESLALTAESGRTWQQRHAEFQVSVDGGVLVRGKADGTMRSKFRLGGVPGPGGAIVVSVTPSQGDGVSIVDTVLAAGPDLSLRFRRDLGLEAMAALGAEIHSFRGNLDSGGTADLHAALPISFSWPLTPGARMYALTEGAFSRGRREHGNQDSVEWSRTAWSVRAAIGISYGWRIQ